MTGAIHTKAVNSMYKRSCPRSIHVGVYSQLRAPAGPWCSSEMRMSAIRSRMRWRDTLAVSYTHLFRKESEVVDQLVGRADHRP